MFCRNCGAKLRDGDCFCGVCGSKVESVESKIGETPKTELPKVVEPEVVYIEEKPMESILDNQSVIGLTLFFFMLSLLTIIGISVITRDVPVSNKLEEKTSYMLY